MQATQKGTSMRLFLATVLLALMPMMAASHEPERTDVEVKELALEAILENPEIILEAVAILEQRERDQKNAGAAQVVANLEANNTAPVFGNPDGDITVVEFFDYNCGFCRRSGPALKALLDSDPNVRVIMREWPILGEASVFAARAALAARNQGKYEEFHWGLMTGAGRASEATVRQLATDLGMDVDKLMADMATMSVDAHIDESNQLARTLGFTGTPAFIVGGNLRPGFMNEEELKQAVNAAREG